MSYNIHYLIRSKIDGKYLAARPGIDRDSTEISYLLIFRENFEALSYLNTHGGSLADRFVVESVAGSELKKLLKRWGFHGIALVIDPLVPQIDFLSYV